MSQVPEPKPNGKVYHLDFTTLDPVLGPHIGRNGAKNRTFPGLYITGLAQLIEYKSPAQLSRILNGDRRASLKTVSKIAAALGLSIEVVAGLYKQKEL